MGDPDTSRFELQLRLFEKGAEELQRQVSRLDDLLFKIKASGITVWVALIGWSFTAGVRGIIALGAVVVIGFWLLEGLFRAAQIRFIDRSRRLTALVNDVAAMDEIFQTRHFPPDVVYPVAFKDSQLAHLRTYVRALVSAPVATLYLFLGFITLLIWLATS